MIEKASLLLVLSSHSEVTAQAWVYQPVGDYTGCSGSHCNPESFSGQAFKHKNHILG